MERIEIVENGLFLVFEIADDKCFKFLHFGKKPFNEKDIIARSTSYGFRFVEINLAGYDRPYERHGNKYIVTAPGWHMRYESMEDGRNQNGRIVMFVLRDEITDVIVKSYMQFYDGLSIIRFWNIVENTGSQTQVLDYISSFNYEGIDKEGSLPADKKLQIRIPHNGWQKEVNWKTYDLCDFGMERIQPACDQRSSNLLTVSNTGNWSAKEHLPMGYLENTQTHTGMLWQIENNGSWHWEIGDSRDQLYLQLSGPTEAENHWYHELKPQESFESVHAAVAVTAEGFEDAAAQMTQWRRLMRRKNEDDEKLPVIFNDFMNCLGGDPSEEKEYPLIEDEEQDETAEDNTPAASETQKESDK